MQWTLYLLSKHPEIQEKMYKEVKDMYPDGGTFDKANIQHMHLIKAVIKESMRYSWSF